MSGVVIFLESLLKKSSDWDLSYLISFLFFYMISQPPKTMREREREVLIRERERDYITIREGQFSPLALFWWALSG